MSSVASAVLEDTGLSGLTGGSASAGRQSIRGVTTPQARYLSNAPVGLHALEGLKGILNPFELVRIQRIQQHAVKAAGPI